MQAAADTPKRRNSRIIFSGKRKPAEQPLLDNEVIVDRTNDSSKVFCFGDSLSYLKFDVGEMVWSSHAIQQGGDFDGTSRYYSACFVPDRKIFLTGGCSSVNSLP